MKRTLLIFVLAAACLSGCFFGKNAKDEYLQAKRRAETLKESYTFQSENDAYEARLLAIFDADAYPDGLPPLISREEAAKAVPAIPQEAWRAASQMRLPASFDGKSLVFGFKKCLYCLDLASLTPLWKTPVGKGAKTVIPYKGRLVVQTGGNWNACLALNPKTGEVQGDPFPAPDDLPAAEEMDKGYVRFSLSEKGVHCYEFPGGPVIRCHSQDMPPRMSYRVFGAFDPKTSQTQWVMKFRNGAQAFNRAGNSYFFLSTDERGVGCVYVFAIAPNPKH